MSNQHIVIIGAGAAGIAAARYFANRGKQTLILEATPFVGGRVRGHQFSDDLIWDEGAHWLHDVEGPHDLFRHAKKMGLVSTPLPGQNALVTKDGEWLDGTSFWEDVETFLMKLPITDPDTSIAKQMPKRSPFWEHVIQSETGFNSKSVSANDHAFSRYGKDIVLKNGYSDLLQKLSQGLDIYTNTTVKRVSCHQNSVAIYTDKRQFNASAVIITVSVGVLQSNLIVFDPPLSKKKNEAISHLKMGLAARVGIYTSHACEKFRNCSLIVELDEKNMVGLELFPFGKPIITCYFAGPDVRQYEQNDKLLEMSFRALDTARIDVRVTDTKISSWTTNPYFLGSYSGAGVGHTWARPILAESRPPLFFAGEATSTDDFGTASGAWDTGTRAAAECLAHLNKNQSTAKTRTAQP